MNNQVTFETRSLRSLVSRDQNKNNRISTVMTNQTTLGTRSLRSLVPLPDMIIKNDKKKKKKIEMKNDKFSILKKQ